MNVRITMFTYAACESFDGAFCSPADNRHRKMADPFAEPPELV